jgi:hypothetical protein
VYALTRRSKAESVLRLVARHWSSFRPFFDGWHQRVSASRDERDAACAAATKHVRFLLERELVIAMAQQPAAYHSASTSTAHSISTAEANATRLTTLYRGLLALILAHQASHQLVRVQYPVHALRTEFDRLERVALERDRVMASLASGSPTAAAKAEPS